jgi:cysteine-rich repeat protein
MVRGIAACVARTTTCRACQTLRIGGSLTVDCTLQHDGTPDLNCMDACGDGEVAGVFTCDDGNRESGDGCDFDCRPSVCGNGLTSPDEFCDSSGYSFDPLGGLCVGGTYDGLPCSLNDDCAGGYCTSCPHSNNCRDDCTACDVPFCIPPNVLSSSCHLYTGAPCVGQGCPPPIPSVACDAPECGTEGNCTIAGYCVPTDAATCAEYEGIVASCVLGPS